MNLADLNIDSSWTLFLDRDGVINKENTGDYVKNIKEFEFLPKVLNALEILSGIFDRIIILTNQRGIAKGIMNENDLNIIHDYMVNKIESRSGRIDKIYHCPHQIEENCNCRKPKPGLALQAKEDYPEIVFEKSFFVGDKITDIEMGQALSMISIYLRSDKNQSLASEMADHSFDDLFTFASSLVYE